MYKVYTHSGRTVNPRLTIIMPAFSLIRYFPRLSFVLCAFISIFFRCISVQAAEPPSPGHTALLEKYTSIKAELAKNQFGIPLYLLSKTDARQQLADLYGIFDYPFAALREALNSPADWCDIIPLDLNIKACTFELQSDQRYLTLYAGRKYYQSPGEAYKLNFNFQVAAERPDYLDVTLDAEKGPFLTEDYRIRLEAVPLDATASFVHFSYSYRFGLLARLAMKGYLATVGRSKMGFSIAGHDKNGNPVYVGGLKGAVERNAVRYYLALQAYMDTLKLPYSERFEKRLGRWYDLAARYPEQLYEMSRDEYLDSKKREHENQLKLQKRMGVEAGKFACASSSGPSGKK